MSEVDVQMEGIVEPTFNKRRKGYTFKKDGMEIFIKGEDKEAVMKQMSDLLESNKKEEKNQTHSFAEGGMEDGGLKDEGGSVDPVSGNDVPSGSTQSEVRDDIPAQLSEGEFVLPADVVRYIGLENLMELRSKAKQGLAKMEAMGQMGNADEATMDDSGEYDGEIDELIESFDPNDPSTFEFNEGGVVTAQQGMFVPPNMGRQQQQFSYGYGMGAGTGYTPPGQQQLPQYTQFVTDPARVAVGQKPVAPELRRYVGPGGEEIVIPFYDGKPMRGYTIPAGYKYKPQEEVVEEAPVIGTPKVSPDMGGGDDRAREEAEAGRIAQEKELNNLLAKYDPEFAKVVAEDPFMTGKLANPYTALMATFNTVGARTDTIPGVLGKFGIPVKDFEVPGIGGKIPGNKYDVGKLANTLRTADLLVEQFGIDQGRIGNIISYTNLDTDGDGRVTRDDLVDKSGNLTKAGQDLFMDEDGVDYSKQDFPVTEQTRTQVDTSSIASSTTAQEQKAAASRAEALANATQAVRDAFAEEKAKQERAQRSSGADGPGSDNNGGGGGGGQAGADAAGDASGSSPFAKGGLAEQTQRVLKSSRKKK